MRTMPLRVQYRDGHPALVLQDAPECRKAPLDHGWIDTGADAEEAGTAEAVRRDEQQIFLFGALGEGMGVAARGLDHHVECALGLHTLVAHFRQGVVERVAVFFG